MFTGYKQNQLDVMEMSALEIDGVHGSTWWHYHTFQRVRLWLGSGRRGVVPAQVWLSRSCPPPLPPQLQTTNPGCALTWTNSLWETGRKQRATRLVGETSSAPGNAETIRLRATETTGKLLPSTPDQPDAEPFPPPFTPDAQSSSLFEVVRSFERQG